jgi:single-strand DNA-binding protein
MNQPHSVRPPAKLDTDDDSFNIAVLRGVLATGVRISELPAGSVVYNFDVRAGGVDGPHVVPIAWRDPVRPPRLARGDDVVVVGSVRRRWFRAGGASQSRTELLASCVARSSSARARRGLAGAVEAIVASRGSNG